MIRAYKLEHSINIQKQEKIFELFSSYRKLSQKISQVQWNNFFKSKKFDKNLDIKTLKTPLSARYKQVSQYQVVGQLQSYLANRQNDFRDIVYKSNLEEATKKELFYINKSKKWFCNEIMIKKIEVSQEIIFLSRKIFKKILKKTKNQI
jgi:putative transposase